jgi:hypothetical protein
METQQENQTADMHACPAYAGTPLNANKGSNKNYVKKVGGPGT